MAVFRGKNRKFPRKIAILRGKIGKMDDFLRLRYHLAHGCFVSALRFHWDIGRAWLFAGGASRQSGSPANHLFSLEKQDTPPMFRPAIKKIATHRYLGRSIVTFRRQKFWFNFNLAVVAEISEKEKKVLSCCGGISSMNSKRAIMHLLMEFRGVNFFRTYWQQAIGSWTI